MAIELRNSDRLPKPTGFSHAAVGTGSQVVHFAGHIGTTADGAHPDGLTAQTEQAIRNLADAILGTGFAVEDLAKLTIYVVGWNQSMIGELFAGLGAAADLGLATVPITLVGAQALFLDESLVEVEAVLVAD